MANMSYCRYVNTMDDLQDCLENLETYANKEEFAARARLIHLCREIINEANRLEIKDRP